jgi:hypothetical protein
MSMQGGRMREIDALPKTGRFLGKLSEKMILNFNYKTTEICINIEIRDMVC